MLVRVTLLIALVSALHAMLGAAWVPVSDPDVWWVAAAGREMLATHAVPTQNVFSFVEPTQPWIMHEWLLGPVYAWGVTKLGPAFFALVATATLATGLWLISHAVLGRATQQLAASWLLCVSALFFLRRLQTARPSCVSLLFPLLISLLSFGTTFSPARLVGCILCEWLWANVHGSFPIGIGLLLAAAIDQPRDRPLRVLAALGAALVTLVNPYGLALHGFVWNYFWGRAGIYREIHSAIPEFSSMWQAWGSLITWPEALGFGCVALMAVAAACHARYRWRGLVCVALLWAAARQARHLELAGLVSCVLLVPWADAWVVSWSTPAATDARFRRCTRLWLLGPSYALGLSVLLLAGLQRKADQWISAEYAFLGSLAGVADSARLYVPFRGAGLAIWYGYPRGIRIFYDPRNDCYSVSTLRAFAALGKHDGSRAAQQKARQILAETNTDSVLIPATHLLKDTLATAPDWQLRARQPGYLFQRRPLRVLPSSGPSPR